MDAILVQILRNKIASLVEEMHYHFYRSGYSTIIRESRDFSCVILDRNGRLIIAPPMFFHAPVYRHLVTRILALYRDDRIKDGDVFVSNHPYEAGMPHVSDMAFVAPIFAGGEIIGFAGSIAHKADVGGAVPGSTSATATEMYHEGLLVPPVKIWAQGKPLPDIERIILTNSRQPVLMRGDIHAQIAATQMGVERVKELAARFGAGALTQAFAATLKGATEELRAALAKLPEGTSYVEGFLDSDGIEIDKPIKLAVAVTIKDGLAHFDFTKCDPQAKGPVNLRPSMAEACVFYSLIGSLGPDIAYNDGMREVVRITYAPRTIVNADPPSPVSSYQMVNLALADVIIEALAHFNPKRALAHSGASSALSIAWSNGRPGQINQQYEIAGSAYGGGMGCDGATAVATHLSNLHSTPIEVLESEFPCRITRFDLVPDSGGPGRWRGGLAMRREYELLEDATVIRRFNKTRFPPKGVADGRAGSRARFVVRVGTDREFETPASARVDMHAGERFLLQSAGGGGYGDPHQRDRDALKRDIAEGYVTKDGAVKDYGQNE
jgi:N-methylhydantoinase B